MFHSCGVVSHVALREGVVWAGCVHRSTAAGEQRHERVAIDGVAAGDPGLGVIQQRGVEIEQGERLLVLGVHDARPGHGERHTCRRLERNHFVELLLLHVHVALHTTACH
jgi:hypothetical protein